MQQELDFTNRGYRRSLLQAFRCPNVEIVEGTKRPTRRIMKARDLKAILRTIDDFGVVCYATHKTIAGSADCDTTHLKRCIRALRGIGLIAEIPRSHGVEYHIVWSEIALANAESDRPTSGSITMPTNAPDRVRGRPTDRPTSGSTRSDVVDPLVDPLVDPNRSCGRPTGGSTNREPLTINRRQEPEEGETLPAPQATATKVEDDPWSAATRGVKAAGCELAPVAVSEAKSRGIGPEQLAQAAYVVRHTDGLDGGAILFWIRNGGWPKSGVRSAAEIRSRREQLAASRRQSVRVDASARSPPPEDWFVAGVCAKRLLELGLDEFLTDEERSGYQRMTGRALADDAKISN